MLLCFFQGCGRVCHHSFSQRMTWGTQTRGVEQDHSFPDNNLTSIPGIETSEAI